jgi:hypothetical protein
VLALPLRIPKVVRNKTILLPLARKLLLIPTNNRESLRLSAVYQWFLIITFTTIAIHSSPVEARSKVPLLPPRAASSDDPGSATSLSLNPDFNRFSFGIETAVTGAQSLDKDSASKSYVGARLFTVFGIFNRLNLKVSVGAFQQIESTIDVAQMEKIIEGGVIAQFTLLDFKSWSIWAGIANRLDYVAETNTLTIVNTPTATTSRFRYRVGPAAGTVWKLGLDLDATADLEGTYLINAPYVYGAITIGLVYHLF